MTSKQGRLPVTPMAIGAHPVIDAVKRQFGAGLLDQSDYLSINTSAVNGKVVEYTSAVGLDVLLVQYETHISFSLDLPTFQAKTPFLLVSLHRTPDVEDSILAVRTSAFTLMLPPGTVGTLILVGIRLPWLQSNLPNWTSLSADLFGERVAFSLAHDALLLNLIRTEVHRFWQSYPTKPLKSIFVWKTVYHLLGLVLERSFHESHRKVPSPHSPPDVYQIEQVYRYIRENISQDQLSVPALARMANMSVSKFSRLFKEIYQVSVSEFMNEYRLEMACDLLMTRQYSLGQIAGKVGFQTTSGLTKLFLKKYGIPPKYFLDFLF